MIQTSKGNTLKSIPLCFVFFFAAVSALAQDHGKPAPKEIRFAAGNIRATVSGTLAGGREANYFFKAQKGQQVTIRNPRWNMFDFRVFSEENFPDGDFDSSPTYTFEIPETGDYLFYVRKKMASPRTAKFSMTITIK